MDTSRLKKLAEQLRKQEEMKKSIRTARQRQLYMLPKLPTVPGMEFHSFYQPAANVSGDFYDIIDVKENLIGIALGDVSGHGLEAGIIMGMAKKALQIYAKDRESPKDTLVVTNNDLAKDLDGETFLSAAYAVLDTQNMIFRLVRAGHNPAFLLNRNRKEVLTEIKPNGMVIGVDKSGKHFPVITVEEEIQLQSGDLVFQYTDGLVEAPNRTKEEFGEKRLMELLLKYADLGPKEIIGLLDDAVQHHIGAAEQEDDITMIAFKVK